MANPVKVTLNIRERDFGMKDLRKRLQALMKKPAVKVGILAEDAGKKKDFSVKYTETSAKGVEKTKKAKATSVSTTLLEVAIANEFGVDKQGKNGKRIKIPERSFIRATVAREKKNWEKYQAELFKQLLTASNGMTVEKALGLLGEKIQADIQRAFVDPGFPDKPNSKSTIARKGSSRPLVDTGQLRRSIRWKRVSGESK